MPRSALPGYFLYGDAADDLGLDTLNIEELRERSSRHDWIIRPHFHPRHVQLMLFTKGGAMTRVEQQVLQPTENTLIIHPAGMVHDIQYQPGSEGMTITVAKSYVDALTRESPQIAAFLGQPVLFSLGDAAPDFIADFLRILTETRQRSPGWDMAVRGRFASILVGLHRLHHQATQPPRPRRDLQLATELIEIVEKNFRHLRKMSDYASLLAISPQRLNAACQSALGCSASQILHDRLLTEARRLLAYTELTVAEVGHELGFDDPAYFNRFFANRAGHPPGAWRAAHSATLRADPERSVD